MRLSLVICIYLCSLQYVHFSAQLIIMKDGFFGLINEQTGEQILPRAYDTIYSIPFDKHITNSTNFISNSPLFACQRNDSIRIFNAYEHTFLNGVYNEVRFTEETDDKYYPFPKQYNPNHIDCIMLRTGDLWGYIAHPKTYGFHDELTKADEFEIIEPQYRFLRFVEENVYTGHEYKRRNRIIVARKDSLYGALAFESGMVIVPFKYKVPIDVYSNAYNRRGLEFLSTKGGFIPYFIARNGYDSPTQVIINAQGNEASFKIDFPYTLEIYNEENEDFLYVFSKEIPNNTLQIWNYNTGKMILDFHAEPGFKIAATRRDSGVLKLSLYNRLSNRYQVIWINLFNQKVILFKEGGLNRMYRDVFNEYTIENQRYVSYKRPRNIIGVIQGEKDELCIKWVKKPFLK